LLPLASKRQWFLVAAAFVSLPVSLRMPFRPRHNISRSILAVPILAMLKIVTDGVRPVKALGHVLEGRE
jgi:hypothetical protein